MCPESPRRSRSFWCRRTCAHLLHDSCGTIGRQSAEALRARRGLVVVPSGLSPFPCYPHYTALPQLELNFPRVHHFWKLARSSKKHNKCVPQEKTASAVWTRHDSVHTPHGKGSHSGCGTLASNYVLSHHLPHCDMYDDKPESRVRQEHCGQRRARGVRIYGIVYLEDSTENMQNANDGPS